MPPPNSKKYLPLDFFLVLIPKHLNKKFSELLDIVKVWECWDYIQLPVAVSWLQYVTNREGKFKLTYNEALLLITSPHDRLKVLFMDKK